MVGVHGHATAHQPIKTDQEVALYDKLVSEHGGNNHDAIAAAVTHEDNQVAANVTRLLWPKHARHIKDFQRKREQQHLTKRQGLHAPPST
jgi:hypothetical protein